MSVAGRPRQQENLNYFSPVLQNQVSGVDTVLGLYLKTVYRTTKKHTNITQHGTLSWYNRMEDIFFSRKNILYFFCSFKISCLWPIFKKRLFLTNISLTAYVFGSFCYKIKDINNIIHLEPFPNCCLTRYSRGCPTTSIVTD